MGQINVLETQNRDLESAKSHYEGLAGEVSDYKTQVLHKQSQIAKLEDDLKETLEAMDSQIACLNSTNQQQSQEISEMKKKASRAEVLVREIQGKDEKIN